VLAVLDAPCANHLDGAAGAAQWKIEAVDAVADANLLEQPGRVVGELRGFGEVLRDLIKEVRLSAHAAILSGLEVLRSRGLGIH
jgi:hypothetical protein